MLIPAALVGVVGVFVTTCQGGGVTDTVAMAPAPLVPTPTVGAPAPVVTAPASDSKPPIDSVPPVSAALRTPAEPTSPAPPSPAPPSRVEPPARPAAPAAPEVAPEPAPAAPAPRLSGLRMRPPILVGAESADAVYALFESRRGALTRCRSDRDEVAYVILFPQNGAIGLARSDPNVPNSETDAAACVASAFRGQPIGGGGIVRVAVELGARGG
ncbi:MAG: hypothetical protein KC586_12440 [Myxococcales bacterium]|nr:hypothetical protein [Myxococcales bacterium]